MDAGRTPQGFRQKDSRVEMREDEEADGLVCGAGTRLIRSRRTCRRIGVSRRPGYVRGEENAERVRAILRTRDSGSGRGILSIMAPSETV